MIKPGSLYRAKELLRYIFTTLLFLTLTPPVFSAFQESLWGARPASMMGAFTAVADDANAPVYNPAGISWVENNEMTFMYARLFSGLNFYVGDETSRLGLGYFSFIPDIKNKRYGSYAVSFTNFVATNLYREDSVLITFSDTYQLERFRFKPVLSGGLTLKYLRRSFSTDQRTDADPVFRSGRDTNAVTGDIGLIIKPNFPITPGLKFGLVAQNITEPNIGLSSSDRIPARYAFGVAYRDSRYRLINPSLDVSRRNGRTLVSAAWESWIVRDTLAFRFGGNADQLGGGIGYNFHLFEKVLMKLDYGILWPLNVDGSDGSHRVSISTAF